jgi:hypothetical protein
MRRPGRERGSRIHDDSYNRGEVLYGRSSLTRGRNGGSDLRYQQPYLNSFQNLSLTPILPLQRPLPIGIPQGVQPNFIIRRRRGDRQLIRSQPPVPGAPQVLPGPPLNLFPQAQPRPPSYHSSAAAAPEPPIRAPTQAPPQYQPNSAKPQSSQRVQSAQREPSSYSTFEPPPPYKT